jgi:hypothetical protein
MPDGFSPALPQLPTIQQIHDRLQDIFPPATPQQGYLTREIAARTVYTFLYIDAVEGTGIWLAPKHVYLMTEEQSGKTDDKSRHDYAVEGAKPGFKPTGERWYADNTREPIRDETLKEGLVQIGAVVTRPGVPTTSSKGRYALQHAFALLFDPNLQGSALDAAIDDWRQKNLSTGALSRTLLKKKSAAAASTKVSVSFPTGEVRQLDAGPSSEIAKGVVEDFAPRYLREPVVVWISESGQKVSYQDDELAKQLGLNIDQKQLLPDMILSDIGSKDTMIVFVEVVASDGPINENRRAALRKMGTDAGYSPEHLAYVTAFEDRDAGPFKKNIGALAVDSFVWFRTEPHLLMAIKSQPEDGSGDPTFALEDLV